MNKKIKKNKNKMDVEEIKEIEELKSKYNKENYKSSAGNYLPDKIKYLLIAESPPYSLSKDGEKRYFYFETVTEGDTFLVNTIKSIYSVEKYTGSSKKVYLERLKCDGFFLIDAVEYPINQFKEKKRKRHVRYNFDNLLEKIENLKKESYIEKDTKIILIKKGIFEELEEDLKGKGFNVLNEKLLPFPDWGRNATTFQKELHELLSDDGFFEI